MLNYEREVLQGFLILLVTITSSLSTRLTRYDQYTCFDKHAREYYCCSNYEEINGACIKCKLGFQSRNGKTCEPCSFNLFGKGCTQQCNCNDLQGCDNVIGCVNRDTTRNLATRSNTSNGFYSVESTTMVHINEKNDGKNEGSSITKTELLMLYSGASSGILVLVGLLCILYCFKKRICVSKPKHVETTQNDEQKAARDTKQECYELNERIYEEIDDTNLVSILHSHTCTAKMTTHEESSFSEDAPNFNLCFKNKSIREKSLNAVPIVIIPKSEDNQISCLFHLSTDEDSSSSESTEDFNRDRASYLHPYNTLSSKTSYSHAYEGAKNVDFN